MPVDRLIQLVERRSDQLRQSASDDRRKAMGQYYTAVRIAEFMASLPDMPVTRHVRVLDPGAGAGILGICAARSLLQRGAESVHIVAVERDTDSVAALNQSLSAARRSFGVRFSYEVRSDDFLNSTGLTLGREPIDPVDIAISNPPYFKVAHRTHGAGGAPNIYAQFMSVASQLLKPGGQICFIVRGAIRQGSTFGTSGGDSIARWLSKPYTSFDRVRMRSRVMEYFRRTSLSCAAAAMGQTTRCESPCPTVPMTFRATTPCCHPEIASWIRTHKTHGYTCRSRGPTCEP